LEIIKQTLESGEDVMIFDFGKFHVKDKRKLRGRNPSTGDGLKMGLPLPHSILEKIYDLKI